MDREKRTKSFIKSADTPEEKYDREQLCYNFPLWIRKVEYYVRRERLDDLPHEEREEIEAEVLKYERLKELREQRCPRDRCMTYMTWPTTTSHLKQGQAGIDISDRPVTPYVVPWPS